MLRAKSSNQIYSGINLLICDSLPQDSALWVNSNNVDGQMLSELKSLLAGAQEAQKRYKGVCVYKTDEGSWSLGWLDIVMGKAKERRELIKNVHIQKKKKKKEGTNES